MAASLAALLAGVSASAAIAQDRSAHEQSNDPDQIVVYGSKIASTLDDTHASVAVVTADDIEDREILSFRSAFRMMGNVLDGDWADAGFIIRGVNSEGLTPGGGALASVYVDGVRQTVNGARRGARGLWDVQQLEVYRGPQSTLSGRASLAGAIYIKTKDPTFEWEGAARATIGNMDTWGGAIALGGPLVEDQLAIRIAGEYSTSKNDINYPTYKSFKRYDEFVEDEYYHIRGKLLFTPTGMPDTKALLTYSFSHDSPYTSDIAGPVLGFDYKERRGDFNLPVYAESRSGDVHNAGLEITHEFSPALTLTSMTSYSASDTQRPSVNEGTPGETEVTAGGFDQDLFSQELRLNYNQGAVRAVLGGYLEVEDANAGYSRVAFGRTDVSRSTSKATNMAIFGELAYEVIPSLEVIAGGRGDYTKTKSTAFFSRNNVVSTNTATSGDEFVFLPKVGLTKKLGDRQSLGFSVQRGFRGGGQVFQRSTGTVRDFDPEYTWTYELSYKGSFLDNKLRVSANAFYTDWKDQQVEVRENPLDFTSSYITNAAKSELYGFELEARGELSKELSAFASVGHVKTEFKDFVDLTLGNLTGMAFPEAPEWNLAFGMNYECACGFFVGADAKYVSDYQSRIDFAPHERLDGYWVANAQVGFRARHWEIMLFAENLFDNTYYVSDSQTDLGGGLLGDVARTLGARRSYGVHLTGRF